MRTALDLLASIVGLPSDHPVQWLGRRPRTLWGDRDPTEIAHVAVVAAAAAAAVQHCPDPPSPRCCWGGTGTPLCR